MRSIGENITTVVINGISTLDSGTQFALPGDQIDAIDYNSWVVSNHGPRNCYELNPNHQVRYELLYSTRNSSPVVPNKGTTFWLIELLPEPAGTWAWSNPKELRIESGGPGLAYPGRASLAEIDALAYDQTNGILVYSLQDSSNDNEFLVVPVEEIRVYDAVRDYDVLEGFRFLTKAIPLKDPFEGQTMGRVVRAKGHRPSAICGIDPEPLKLKSLDGQ